MQYDDILQRLANLQPAVDASLRQLKIVDLQADIDTIKTQQQEPYFWDDTTKAQATMQRFGKLTQMVEPWQNLQQLIKETQELALLKDDSLLTDISSAVADAEKTFATLKKQTLYTQPYDDHDAILSIYAGAGGTDAQDWAQMLLRMYTRWAEQNNFKVSLLQESAGEEAGIKSVTLDIVGALAYGKLKGEHGVHRLVRLSPFNADNLRQTSFAKVDVLPKISAPDEVVLDEKDLKIDVYRAGGHGGQSVNTTDSAVRVTHLPTGITVAIQNERSQLQNKETALTILRSRLAQLQIEQHADTIKELKGPNEQAAWGNQIRNYVLHPYTMVKDARTKVETTDANAVLDGSLENFIDAYSEHIAAQSR
jgi:peptide chain release factor 2